MVELRRRPNLKRRHAKVGRPKTEEYVRPDQLTKRMKKFAEGIASGLMPAQVGVQMNIGQAQIESWLNNVAMQEYIKELNYEKSILNDMDEFEEMKLQTREKTRALHYCMLDKLYKGEVPWNYQMELLKLLSTFQLTHNMPQQQTIKATETEEITTMDMLREHMDPKDLLQATRAINDPEYLPVELGGGGKKVKHLKRRELEVTKDTTS